MFQKKPGVSIFTDIINAVTMFIKTIFTVQYNQYKLRELEIMHQNAIYICTFWYIKIW